jgi:hypothetical protein
LTAQAAQVPPALADCDGRLPSPCTPHQPPRRGYWLNRQLIKWPGADAAGGIFKLYFSATAQLRATAGARVMGADDVIALSRFEGALPADIAQRFKFVGGGAVWSSWRPPTQCVPEPAAASIARAGSRRRHGARRHFAAARRRAR